MDTLRLKPRPPVDDDFENWDDDGDFMIEEDINLRSASGSTNPLPNRRDSHSSFRSDLESIPGGAEEKQVHLPGDDEKSTLDAIAAAANAGIPIPTNVPSSALMGGTIKRLGGRKIKKIFQDDWGDDLELPDQGQGLQIKPTDASQFPDILRQVSNSTHPSPIKPATSSPTAKRAELKLSPRPMRAIDLARFRDDDDDDGFLGDGADTIKVPKQRSAPKPISMITPPTPQKGEKATGEDDFELDLELPSDGKLSLSNRREIPKTPSLNTDEFDWGEGSLGTRFGGTRRDGRSNRSSSASALSPSVSSSITAESEGEDDGLDGLVLPQGPLNFEERLKQRRRQRQSQSPERPAAIESPPRSAKTAPPAAQGEPEKEDVLSGLDLGDGEVFDSGKITLHRHIQVKETRGGSPTRPKTAVALKFVNKPAMSSRLPRPSHERTHTQSSLEPVSESGGPIPPNRRSQSRLGHSAQSSVSSIQTPTTPSSVQSLPPSTPKRREIGQKTSTVSLRHEPTTTSAQLLRLKRSLPAMRPPQSPARPPTSGGYERPPSRSDNLYRPSSSLRPKTPVERGRLPVESAAAQARRNPLPFLPAGASQSQSQHVTTKSSRLFRRHDSENSIDLRPGSRAVSRSTIRSPSPRKHWSAERVGADSNWQHMSKPRRPRQFGDGHELDGFDDLPTSSRAEAKFMRPPVTKPQAPLRNKVFQAAMPDRTNTPSPFMPFGGQRLEYVPHFARDTAASRMARESSLSHRTPSNGPLAALTSQRSAQQLGRVNNIPPPTFQPESTIRYKRYKKPLQLKPHLIANLNSSKESKTVNGMFYNPETFRWEGNENALNAFDRPASSPSTASLPVNLLRGEGGAATPRPALITNIGATKGVQVVGGMIFDPQNMCWLKRPQSRGKATSESSDPLDGFNALEDPDDEDVFKDIPDLEEKKPTSNSEGADGDDGAGGAHGGGGGSRVGRVSEVKDDWLVGEEFDVGPAFIRRTQEEEERWRKKLGAWQPGRHQRQDSWKWKIRDIIIRASSRDV